MIDRNFNNIWYTRKKKKIKDRFSLAQFVRRKGKENTWLPTFHFLQYSKLII